MTGFFDESGHPKIEIRVIGTREDVTITPTIDTGFVTVNFAYPSGLLSNWDWS
jgi:hypothetical protein